MELVGRDCRRETREEEPELVQFCGEVESSCGLAGRRRHCSRQDYNSNRHGTARHGARMDAPALSGLLAVGSGRTAVAICIIATFVYSYIC